MEKKNNLLKWFQLIVFIAFFLPVSGRANPLFMGLGIENATTALSVVEVSGALKGSGVLLFLDNRPVVLTNSHNLQGAKTASVYLPPRVLELWDEERPIGSSRNKLNYSYKDTLQVSYDFPLEDFAVLEFGNLSKNDRDILQLLAVENGQICVTRKVCKVGWNSNRPAYSGHAVAAVLNGKATSLPMLPVEPMLVEDKSISGGSSKIINIPAFSRPGVSGGAFYRYNVLQGIVTKVSLSGDYLTQAIRMDHIADVLRKPEKFTGLAVWRDRKLIIQSKDDIITSYSAFNGGGETGNGGGETGNGGGETGNGGGETGNGGGETGNGGGETGNGGGDQFNNDYLLREVNGITGKQIVTTWNPFKKRKNIFMLNNESVSFFNVKGQYQLPSVGLYLRNKRKGIEQDSFQKDSAHLIDKERVINGGEINRARIYQYDSKRKLYQTSGFSNMTILETGTLLLLPDKNGNWPKDPQGSNNLFGDFFKTFLPVQDADGFYHGLFSTRRNEKFLLETATRRNLIQKEGTNDFVKILASRDLQNFIFGNEVLSREDHPNQSIILFKHPKKPIRAAYLYNVEDLSLIEKIYVQTPDFLLEFWSCANPQGCLE